MIIQLDECWDCGHFGRDCLGIVLREPFNPDEKCPDMSSNGGLNDD